MQFNDRIEIVTTEQFTNENGFIEEKESIYYKCWCNAKVLSFKEFYKNYTTNNKAVISFRCRICEKLKNIDTLTYKLKFKNNLYNIIYISATDNFVDIKAEATNV